MDEVFSMILGVISMVAYTWIVYQIGKHDAEIEYAQQFAEYLIEEEEPWNYK